ncbi:Nucleotide-binding universal stress protein, UspA family [Fulvimarina manganoxydans]|uniref:Nucleotide-binding universal stress protein, UspA family n=1 Tax=Fulvimarina manganoxydans TaxID=937218 RepID=A0A1W2ASB9_9HYPH|nr:universal stress protein [Fulvimarina manganoxydans]SMC63606.1 Nucleotide-binding universal stress protein, UspA family [Fulvimarina manganoxydans]
MNQSVMNEVLPDDRQEPRQEGARKTAHRFADLGVHVTGTESDAAVVSAAAKLGEMFGAHLEGLLTNHIPAPPAVAAPGVDALAADLRRRGTETGNALFAKAKERLDGTGLRSDLRRVDGVALDFIEATARLARATDLFAIAQPGKNDVMMTPVLEGVLFNAGSAALIVPKEAAELGELETVLIAWRDTPECARAIAAALPLLQRASQVVLVSIAENGSDEERHREPAADTARHLARHGVNVEVRHVPRWKHPAEGILDQAQIVGAGLIVLGAYGHSRLREMILGGVTRELLETSRLPLFMVH